MNLSNENADVLAVMNNNRKFGFSIETGYFLYAAVLACPDLCGRGQTVLLQVNLCGWKSSSHNFGYAALKDLSLTPEKDLPLKNTRGSMLSGRLILNLIFWRGKATE